jgi:peptidoglycan/xylan/chitin deacetylase (PgdA/CDA1 family)
MTHPHLTKISTDEARQEIGQSKAVLENIVGKEVKSFCYPAGYFNDQVEQLVKDAGFTLARTVVRGKTSVGDNRFELPTSVHAYQHASDLWRSWEYNAMQLFNKVEKEGGVYHLWGHSWEIEAHNGWQKLERVLAHIARRPNVSYVTNAELL